jgi:hypothetical protein
MTRATTLLLALAACAANVAPSDRPATFADLDLSTRVPADVWSDALRDVAACIDRPCSLDGWRGYVIDDGTTCLTAPCFRCPATTAQTCGPLPDGCEHERDCPCECAGTTNRASKRIAVAVGYGALRHEMWHACTGSDDEGDEQLQRCGR